ncbi:MAG: hypothetical protein H0U52_04965 [Chloroflexi bacterium]|nr:hypothetical protein [Chloroflexota bacterium]
MAEDEDLEILRPIVQATGDEETGEHPDHEVQERQHRPIVPGLADRESGFSTPTRRSNRRPPSSTRQSRTHHDRSLEELQPQFGARQADRRGAPTEQSARPEFQLRETQDVEQASIHVQGDIFDSGQRDETC